MRTSPGSSRSGCRSSLQREVREYKAVTFDHYAWRNADAVREHGSGDRARVKLAAFAAWIHARRQIGDERRIESSAGKRCWQDPWIDTRQVRFQPTADHVAREFIGRPHP